MWESVRHINSITENYVHPAARPSQSRKVIKIEWVPTEDRLDAETGAHGHSKLACGHFTCVLIDEDGGCEACAVLREKADKERRAKEAQAVKERRSKEAQ